MARRSTIRLLSGVAFAAGPALAVGAALALALSLGACRHHPAQPLLKQPASIRDLMDSEVDPAADALWGSVGTTVTAAGTVDRQPRTDADWKAVRGYAITLAEAPNLLAMPGRKVIEPGQTVDDAGVPGIQAPDVVQKQIDADPAKFVRHAQALQGAGLQALAAVNAKDPAALLDAGAAIDEACEACHVTYWYPNSPKPRAPGVRP
jgi:hypothetical protein